MGVGSMTDSKSCTKCQIVKPLSDFGAASRNPKVKQSICKKCVKVRQTEWCKRLAAQHEMATALAPSLLKCRLCGEEKPGEEFGRRANTKLGFDNACLECWRKKDRVRY